MIKEAHTCTTCPVAATLTTALEGMGELLDSIAVYPQASAADIAADMQPMLADLLRCAATMATYLTDAGANDGQQ